MGIVHFIVFMFINIAIGLSLAFFVLYFASKAERIWLKNIGLLIGWLIMIMSITALVTGLIFSVRKPYMFAPPHFGNHERMMKKDMPMMPEQKMERHQTGGACSIR